MSIFPITPLVRKVQGLILATFEVSEQVAQDYAAELVALAEDRGSPEKAAQLDWSYRIKKDLGEKFPWKSNADRAPRHGASSPLGLSCARMKNAKVFVDVDLTLVDGNRKLLDGAREGLQRLRDEGCHLLLWSTCGPEYWRQDAALHGLTEGRWGGAAAGGR